MSLPLNLVSEVSDKIAVRFFNISNIEADIIWINFLGDYVKYCTLKPKQFIDVNTYTRHYWIFMEKNTSKNLLANKKLYFFAEEQIHPKQLHSRNARYCVCISRALVPSLTSLGVNFFSHNLKNCSVVKYLELPRTLKKAIIMKMHSENKKFHSNDKEKEICERTLNPEVQIENPDI